MPSIRARLTLDEQAFQGLLSAAFTIQEHNDRSRRDPATPAAPRPPASASLQETASCKRCGAKLQSENAPCKACGDESLRPGERLQRNWASLWLMSQERSLWPERGNGSSTPPAFQNNGNGHDGLAEPEEHSYPASSVNKVGSLRIQEDSTPPDHLDPRNGNGFEDPTKTDESSENGQNFLREWPRVHAFEDSKAPRIHDTASDGSRTEKSFTKEVPGGAAPKDAIFLTDHLDENHPFATLFKEMREQTETEELVADDITEPNENSVPAAESFQVSQDQFATDQVEEPVFVEETQSSARDDREEDDHELVLAADSLATNEEPEAEVTTQPVDRSVWNWRVRLRFHRADIYLGLAVLVAFCALLWPTGTPHQPSLSTWDRMLIAMGVAQEEAPPAHYHGDPNLKVWVDTHTALYYCPGDELYGKSSDGHYTTQREAQADRFEPAERSACILE